MWEAWGDVGGMGRCVGGMGRCGRHGEMPYEARVVGLLEAREAASDACCEGGVAKDPPSASVGVVDKPCPPRIRHG